MRHRYGLDRTGSDQDGHLKFVNESIPGPTTGGCPPDMSEEISFCVVFITVPTLFEAMPEEVIFETETTESRESIAEVLRAVADKLEAGEPVTLSAGGDEVSLEVPARPTFEVKAERETGSGPDELSVEFEIEWTVGEDGENGKDASVSVK